MELADRSLNAIILEDDPKRIIRMRAVLARENVDLNLEVFPDAWSCGLRLCDWEEGLGAPVHLILLDHDLPNIVMPDGSKKDAGSGLTVVELLADISGRKQIPPVLIHSSNTSYCVQDMETKLKRCGIPTVRSPAHSTDVPDLLDSELLWIDRHWIKRLKSIIQLFYWK